MIVFPILRIKCYAPRGVHACTNASAHVKTLLSLKHERLRVGDRLGFANRILYSTIGHVSNAARSLPYFDEVSLR